MDRDLREGGQRKYIHHAERYTDGTNLLHVTGSNEKTDTLWAIDYAHTVAIKADHAFGSGYTCTKCFW